MLVTPLFFLVELFFFATGDNWWWTIRMDRSLPSSLFPNLKRANGKPWQLSDSGTLLSRYRTASALRESSANFCWASSTPCPSACLQIGQSLVRFLKYMCPYIYLYQAFFLREEIQDRVVNPGIIYHFPLITIFQRLWYRNIFLSFVNC